MKSGQYEYIQVELYSLCHSLLLAQYRLRGIVYGRINRGQTIKLNWKEKGGSIFCCGPQCAVASIWLCLSSTQLGAQAVVDMFKVGTPCPALATTLYSSAVKVQLKLFLPFLWSPPEMFPFYGLEVRPFVSNYNEIHWRFMKRSRHLLRSLGQSKA